MGDVEDNRVAEFFHYGEGAHVHDEILIAEGSAAFGEDDFFVAGARDFFGGVGHFPGGDELAFFYVDDAAGAACGGKQVGLAAEERGDLQDVADFGGRVDLEDVVDIGEDRQPRAPFYGGQDAQALYELRAAERGDGGAIGFVVGGFEDVGDF